MAPFLSTAGLNNRKLPACVNVHKGFCLSVRVGETQWQSSETAAGRIDCKHSVSRRPIISLFQIVYVCVSNSRFPWGIRLNSFLRGWPAVVEGLATKRVKFRHNPAARLPLSPVSQCYVLTSFWSGHHVVLEWWYARWFESQIQHSFDSSWYISSSMTVRCHMYVFWRFVRNRSVFRFVVNL